MKHKHCELIKAWAEGKTIEFYSPPRDEWIVNPEPNWLDNVLYRIKKEWYEDLGEGVLCWVWSHDMTNSHLDIIFRYDGDREHKFVGNKSSWRNAEPFSKEEVDKYVVG